MDQHVEPNQRDCWVFRWKYLCHQSYAHAWWDRNFAASLANSYRIPENVMASPLTRFSNGILKNSSSVDSTNFTIDIAEMVAKVISMWFSVFKALLLRSSDFRPTCSSSRTELLLEFCLHTISIYLIMYIQSATWILTRQDISHLETPVNTLFCLEPKPYGTQVSFVRSWLTLGTEIWISWGQGLVCWMPYFTGRVMISTGHRETFFVFWLGYFRLSNWGW